MFVRDMQLGCNPDWNAVAQAANRAFPGLSFNRIKARNFAFSKNCLATDVSARAAGWVRSRVNLFMTWGLRQPTFRHVILASSAAGVPPSMLPDADVMQAVPHCERCAMAAQMEEDGTHMEAARMIQEARRLSPKAEVDAVPAAAAASLCDAGPAAHHPVIDITSTSAPSSHPDPQRQLQALQQQHHQRDLASAAALTPGTSFTPLGDCYAQQKQFETQFKEHIKNMLLQGAPAVAEAKKKLSKKKVAEKEKGKRKASSAPAGARKPKSARALVKGMMDPWDVTDTCADDHTEVESSDYPYDVPEAAAAKGKGKGKGKGKAKAAADPAEPATAPAAYGTFIDSEDEVEYEVAGYSRTGAIVKKKKTGRFIARTFDKAYVQKKIRKYQAATEE